MIDTILTFLVIVGALGTLGVVGYVATWAHGEEQDDEEDDDYLPDGAYLAEGGWSEGEMRRIVGPHEYAHYHIGKALGYKVKKPHLSRTENYTEFPQGFKKIKTRDGVSIAYSGGYGARTFRGAKSDKKLAEKEFLRRVRWSQRDKVRREGKAEARRLVRKYRGRINRDARKHVRRLKD